MTYEKQIIRFLVATATAILLASCGTAPKQTSATYTEAAFAKSEALIAAGEVKAAGDYLLASSSEESLSTEEKTNLLVHAAITYADANEIRLAEKAISKAKLLQNNAAQVILAEAIVANADGNSKEAEKLLSNIGTLPINLERRKDQLIIDVYGSSDNPLEIAQSKVAESSYIPSDQLLEHNKSIWQLLNDIPKNDLAELMPPAPDEFGGWLELAYLAKQYRNQRIRLRAELDLWHSRYPEHPANQFAFDAVMPMSLSHTAPKHIGVLLPLTGKLSGFSTIIQEGMMEAYYHMTAIEGAELQISFFDTTSYPSAIEAVADAQDHGCDFLIGPLLKNNVAALYELSPMDIPIIALNSIDLNGIKMANIFQFGLIPEHEAKNAADFAYTQRHKTALLLMPESNDGHRLADAFKKRWNALGNKVAETQYYAKSSHDFSGSIRSLFNIEDSKARHREIESITRLDLKFETYRREDADFLFLDATPQQARLIHPQLRFFGLRSLPVLATSNIYSGKFDRKLDRDIESVLFQTMPTSDTQPTVADAAIGKYGKKRLAKFHLFGHDAIKLAFNLGGLAAGEYVEGGLGAYTLSPENVLEPIANWHRIAAHGIQQTISDPYSLVSVRVSPLDLPESDEAEPATEDEFYPVEQNDAFIAE